MNKPWINETTVEGDEWTHFKLKDGVLNVCCDCGLVHHVRFKEEDGELYIQFADEPEKTTLSRTGSWPTRKEIDSEIQRRRR